jgi:glycine cleavage system H protein
MIPEELSYSKDHEWVRTAGETVTIGITHHAQQEMGDLVFVELPRTGSRVELGGSMGTVESVKAVSEVFSPVTGEVTEVNEALADRPELVNEDPYGEGWMVRVKLDGPPSDLLTADQYRQFLESSAD